MGPYFFDVVSTYNRDLTDDILTYITDFVQITGSVQIDILRNSFQFYKLFLGDFK